MKKRKLFALLAAGIMCVVTACGGFAPPAAEGNSDTQQSEKRDGENQTDGVTIHLMMSNSQEIGVSAAVEAFNKAYKGKIKCDADYVAFNDVFETLEVLMSNKSSEYDIFAADGPNVAAYVKRGYLQPLDQWFSQKDIGEFSEAMQTEAIYDGKFYGAPMGNSSTVMYYNKALLEQAGIQIDFNSIAPDHRLTWEQIVEYGKEAKKKLDPDGQKGIYGVEFQQVGRVYQMNILPNSLGGEQISKNGLSVDGVINTEPWLDALQFYQDEVKAGLFTRGISADDTSSYFMSGKILFYIGTTALPAAFEKNGFKDWGYTYIPCFKGHEDEVKTACGSWTIGMNAYSEHQKEAAEFIRYLTMGDGADVYINASGMVPALTRQFTKDLIASKPYMEVAQYEVTHTALVRAITPGFNEYATSMNAMWDNVRNGADIKKSVDTCIDELNTAFQEYK